MKDIKQISTINAPKAIGPYSQAIVYGDLAFLSGQIALDKDSGLVVGTTIEEQTNQVIKNIGAILKEAGASFNSVIKTSSRFRYKSRFIHSVKGGKMRHIR